MQIREEENDKFSTVIRPDPGRFDSSFRASPKHSREKNAINEGGVSKDLPPSFRAIFLIHNTVRLNSALTRSARKDRVEKNINNSLSKKSACEPLLSVTGISNNIDKKVSCICLINQRGQKQDEL